MPLPLLSFMSEIRNISPLAFYLRCSWTKSITHQRALAYRLQSYVLSSLAATLNIYCDALFIISLGITFISLSQLYFTWFLAFAVLRVRHNRMRNVPHWHLWCSISSLINNYWQNPVLSALYNFSYLILFTLWNFQKTFFEFMFYTNEFIQLCQRFSFNFFQTRSY